MFCADVLDVSDLGKTYKCFPRVHMPAADDRAQHIHNCVCVYSQASVQQAAAMPASKHAHATACLASVIPCQTGFWCC